MAATSYLLGLGSNRRHGRHGRPAQVLAAALDALGMELLARSRPHDTAPLGPGTRRYANIAALIRSELPPPALLAHAKAIERAFGRRSGRRWGDRVLDIDILWWSGGQWRTRALTIPHPALAGRRFALAPMAEIVPHAPIAGARTARHLPARHLLARHLLARLTRARPLP